ncbi:3-oxoacid CoA-transferase subunit A [bacterium]|nr:3-oxoacid CoA-transferase subunit A [bacterium]
MIDKRCATPAAAVADIFDGATVMIGGFGEAGSPIELVHALIDRGTRDLTVVSNNTGSGEVGLAALIRNGQVKRMICSYPRTANSTVFPELFRAGKIELELVPQGTLAERMRAGGAGIPAFYTRTAVGTVLEEGKEQRNFEGHTYVMERGLRADFALVKAWRGDRYGNLLYNKTARNFGPVMCTAARTTIVQVQAIVPAGAIDPECVITPGIFVTRVVEVREPLQESLLVKAEALPAGVGWDRDAMARRLALDIPDGAYVNLGIGMPELVAQFVPEDREVFYHVENGLLGMGPAPAPEQADPELINAGKKPVSAVPGAAYFHHADSFVMIRGGHIDICVLGAMQVSRNGDLANWSTGEVDAIPAVGGAMDLVAGVKTIYVITQHTTKTGEPKLVERCSYPLTGKRCVDRIYTDLAVIDITPQGPVVIALAPGVTFDQVQARTGTALIAGPGL